MYRAIAGVANCATSHRVFLTLPAVTPLELTILAALGLVAGLLGGMLGIGGSLLMIPALAIVLDPPQGTNQHLYQAAAMIVNVFVALPATVQHWRAGAVRWDVATKMMPFALIAILLGVYASNLFDGTVLRKVFGAFLIYVIVFNLVRLITRREEPAASLHRTGWIAMGSVGAVMGSLAGLLGIGGGVVVVPLLQRIGNLPLRQCVATSSATMVITAIIGATMKNATLSQHLDVKTGEAAEIPASLLIAAMLTPTAFIGGMLGAKLTHILPLHWIRLALIVLLTWASAKMLGII